MRSITSTGLRPASQIAGSGPTSEFVATAARLGFNLTRNSFGFNMEPIRGGSAEQFASEADALGFLADKRRELALVQKPAA